VVEACPRACPVAWSQRMNTKAEQPKNMSGADIGKLVLAFLVLAAGVFAYSWYANSVAQSVRVGGVVLALVIALAIGYFTVPGRRVKGFLVESQFELRKVVWPTRDETLKTTGIIMIVVVILSLLLGLIDFLLKTIVFDWLLKLGS
jgi:preprotein translocase subunit SecE